MIDLMPLETVAWSLWFLSEETYLQSSRLSPAPKGAHKNRFGA